MSDFIRSFAKRAIIKAAQIAKGRGKLSSLVDSSLYLLKWSSALVLSDETFVRWYYRLHMGRPLSLDQPRTYNEKLQWLKLYYRSAEMPRVVDKFAVREYVTERVGDDILIPCLGIYDSVDEIDLDALPNSFVLKPTHGSGWVVLCHDKTTFDWKREKARLEVWMRRNFYYHAREWVYRDTRPRIICEELLVDEMGRVAPDYKVFCFNGVPQFIHVDFDRFSEQRRNFYDVSWNRIDVQIRCPPADSEIPRPEPLNEMLDLAAKLSEPFPFCRVDFYTVGSRIYFGEITFFPGNGVWPVEPEVYDHIWGDLLTLPSQPSLNLERNSRIATKA